MNDDDTICRLQDGLDRLHAGDGQAEGFLLAYVSQRWRDLASRALHGSHGRLERFEDTEGLLAELTLRLLQEWRRGSIPTTVADFLRYTGNSFKHLLIDLCRKFYGCDYQRQPPVRLQGGGSDTAPVGHDPASDTYDPARLSFWVEFHSQVEALPEPLREVFLLRWYQDLTTQETALALGISTSLVSNRWIEARLKLQEKLQHQPFAI